MFSVQDETLPIKLLGKQDSESAVAAYFGIRPRGWAEAGSFDSSPRQRKQIAETLAERLGDKGDLQFVKLDVIWHFEDSSELAAGFRKATGLDTASIMRRPVVGNSAGLKDWATLFEYVLAFGWDAVVVSRKNSGLVWFSHDEFLRATPPRIIRGL